MPTLPPRLILFSGLGVSPELCRPQLSLPARVEVIPWIDPGGTGSIGEYAHRMAATIDPIGPLYLAGISFGAMVALELAALLGARGVFIIAGCRSGRQLSPLVRLACRMTHGLPEPIFRALLRGAPMLVRLAGRPDRMQRRFLLELVRTSLPWLMQWGCFAMAEWSDPPATCPIHQIHGSEDWMVPLAGLSPPPDQVIPGGGHIINLTHAEIVNDFIARRMDLR
jgi:pimeloyl-ACP methyl ester carboxylesterase